MLRTALEEFDGTRVEPLLRAVPEAKGNLGALVCYCADPRLAVGATWLVKHLAEAGEDVDFHGVFQTLGAQDHWAAQLHILQIVQYRPELALAATVQVRALLDAKKVLVRVWALDAFVRIADLDADLRKEGKARVTEAMGATSASLRARAKNLNVICDAW